MTASKKTERCKNQDSFEMAAADPETAERLYEHFCGKLAAEGVAVKKGRFRPHMKVSLVNDGPMTIWMDSK